MPQEFNSALMQLGAAGLLIAVLLAICRALWLELKESNKLRNEDNRAYQAALLLSQKEAYTQMAAVAHSLGSIEKAVSSLVETMKHLRK